MFKDHCFLIYGTTRTGVKHPTFLIDGNEMEASKIDDIVTSYRHMYPDSIHIRLDIAYPDFTHVCCDCAGDGWGPILRDYIWKKIQPKKTIIKFYKGHPIPHKFLCERCMTIRLGRPIESDDLRDCPMNHKHPKYKPHGRID